MFIVLYLIKFNIKEVMIVPDNTNEEIIVDEKLYYRITHMSQDQLNTLIHNVYIDGKNDAYSEVDCAVDAISAAFDKVIEKLQSEISQIEGIDENKTAQIIDVIKKAFDNM